MEFQQPRAPHGRESEGTLPSPFHILVEDKLQHQLCHAGSQSSVLAVTAVPAGPWTLGHVTPAPSSLAHHCWVDMNCLICSSDTASVALGQFCLAWTNIQSKGFSYVCIPHFLAITGTLCHHHLPSLPPLSILSSGIPMSRELLLLGLPPQSTPSLPKLPGGSIVLWIVYNLNQTKYFKTENHES